MFARSSILPGISRIEESKNLFVAEIVKQSSSHCVRKLLLKNFLEKLKILWEPSSLVPIFFAALIVTCLEVLEAKVILEVKHSLKIR